VLVPNIHSKPGVSATKNRLVNRFPLLILCTCNSMNVKKQFSLSLGTALHAVRIESGRVSSEFLMELMGGVGSGLGFGGSGRA
jgi:hypothetical protein